MRTIVINTSTEATNTKLDLLFKAPFDASSLIWYVNDLVSIGDVADKIKQRLIDNTDTVDRDYNLIVLVDLYSFPRGNEKSATKLYKAFITRYVGQKLIKRLKDEYSLLPISCAMYFCDSSYKLSSWSPEELADKNPIEQKNKLNAELLRDEELRGSITQKGDLTDDPPAKQAKPESKTAEQRLIMDMFGWSDDVVGDGFNWAIKISLGSDEAIDLSDVFAETASDIKKSHKSAKVLPLAIEAVENALAVESGDWGACARILLNFTNEYPVSCFTVNFERDNEQMIIEGFFNVFANIFRCVQTKTIENKLDIYSSEKIQKLLLTTLKRYKHFSKEDNITVKFEPVARIYAIKDKIFEKRKKVASIITQIPNKTTEEIVDTIMAETGSNKKSGSAAKMHGIDRRFHELVECVFKNYDPDLIKEQNNRIVKQCLTGLWTWRDKQTAEDFKRTVDEAVKEDLAAAGSATKENVREHLTFISDEYEQEYSDLINEVTDAEHRLASNKNILLETKDLVLKYGDLMRKGKWYLMSFIGAIIAVCISIIPYIYVEHYAGNDNLVFKIMYLLFTAGFAALYGVSASIYMGRIISKKRELTWQLEDLKTKSEQERRESLIALYKYYSETVVKTENHCLLWREILRRDRENSKKGIKRNNHIKRLQFLIGEVKRFMTMLKLDCEDDACMVNEEDEKRYAREGLCLNAEESFHSACNQRIYSVLSDDKSKKTNDDEEGGI